MGEWGGNDYYNCFFQNKQIPEVKTYVPNVVAGIMRGIKDLIQQGATRVLVPGIYPLGCLPLYLTSFPDNNTSAYDNLGCLRNYDDFASYHNRYTNRAIANLQPHPSPFFSSSPESCLYLVDMNCIPKIAFW
ncbi:hypothetical protein K7X08_021358 [Anisodus acutangulus]|uniref:GDSL esterase/lipase n=1 Tax=Anisodus acutangulus TaxID=402998 RepID=A0A9Q1M483_9SOLA|nr:hypothetical protein K7X08_021358 [Anisodus acutangulus]